MRLRLVSIVLSTALGVGAQAQAQPASTTTATVELGATQSVPVGYAKGLLCDDLEVVGVELKDGEESNSLEVTGKKLGSTLCRVGLDAVGPKVMVTLHVIPRKNPQARKPSAPPAPQTSAAPAEENGEAAGPEQAPPPAKIPEQKSPGQTTP